MKLYHLSKISMNDDALAPRVPLNYFTKNGYEDSKTARVCLSTSIDGCLRALSQNITGLELYVHVADGNYKAYYPSVEEVPDCKVTGEVWVTKPVTLKCIGKIKVIKDKGEDGIPFTYGNHKAELYDWEWKWVEKYNDNGENILKESYIFSKNDLYINYDKFESGRSNICLITGLSGSGKSTLAEQIASNNKAEWIELDLFEHCNGFTDDQLKEAGQVFYDYLSANKDIWDKLKKKELHGKDLGEEINKFVHYCISWCKKNKSKKWVIEGVQIYSFMKFEEIKSYPLVIKNTSALKSIIQRWKRNGDGKIDLMKELRNEFPQLLAWYKDEEKALSDFRKSIIKENDGILQESKKQKSYAIITDNITITRSYGYTSPKNGIYNAIVDVNASIRARGRSELLVIKGDEVYLSKSKKGLCGDYSVPGGGWDPNEPHDKSAIREAEEEARLKTKNVKYADRYLSLYDEPHDWIKREIPEEYQWRGYYTEVYVGEYAGKYSGKIEDEDKDDIIKTGKFYKIKEVFDELHPIHQNAILNYLALPKNESNNSLQENKLSSDTRNSLSGKDFGIPDKRKYPLTDAKHVKSAIKFFNYVDEEDEAELARNIKRKAKEFGVPIRCGKQNRLSKYINKEYVNEFMAAGAIGNCMYAVNNGNIKQHISQGDHIVSATDSYPFTKKEKKKKKDPVDGRMSVYIGDGEELSVNESSSRVPIYIIAYDYDSLFAGALKVATHSNYNHIAIALSPDLNDAYTFARSVKGDHSIKGFTKEPLSQMIKERGDFTIKVNAVYIPKNAYDKIESMISNYKKHKNDTDYNYGNLIRGVLGVKIDNDDLDNGSMNCSVFVDYLLKSAGIDITGNPNSNLVFPSHLANADEDNDNVITVYCGSGKGYDKKKIARMKFIGESGKVKLPKKCKKCGSSNIGVFIKGEPVFLCKDCGAYNGTVPCHHEEVEPDDTFFDDIMKQFEDLDMESIPTDIFNERKDQA